ncbi:MAG: hypothetical protein AAGL66_01390 [Pseudomonadota bacterium]
MVPHPAASMIQDFQGVEGQSTEVAASRHGPDKNARIIGVLTHTRSIAEERAAGKRRGRVHRDDRYSLAPAAKPGDERIDQRRLADARGPGESDDIRLAALGVNRGVKRGPELKIALNETDGAGKRTFIAGKQPLAERLQRAPIVIR